MVNRALSRVNAKWLSTICTFKTQTETEWILISVFVHFTFDVKFIWKHPLFTGWEYYLTANFRFLKKSQNWPVFGILVNFLATQIGKVARFARNVECDFLADFQTLCECLKNASAFLVYDPILFTWVVTCGKIADDVWLLVYCTRLSIRMNDFYIAEYTDRVIA